MSRNYLILLFAAVLVVSVAGDCVDRGSKKKCLNDVQGCVWNEVTEFCVVAQRCSEITMKEPCIKSEDANDRGCWWDRRENSCKRVDACWQLVDKDVCDGSSLTCKFDKKDDKCRDAPLCGDIKKASECYDSDFGCFWNKDVFQCSDPTGCFQLITKDACLTRGCSWKPAFEACI